mmetsp:Transcript_1098/g.2861  ORF Transcript_1098/g.2861 Transcript_1098/m.2861 type:complete len:237 (-) Transcript_1098:382-1092(-)
MGHGQQAPEKPGVVKLLFSERIWDRPSTREHVREPLERRALVINRLVHVLEVGTLDDEPLRDADEAVLHGVEPKGGSHASLLIHAPPSALVHARDKGGRAAKYAHQREAEGAVLEDTLRGTAHNDRRPRCPVFGRHEDGTLANPARAANGDGQHEDHRRPGEALAFERKDQLVVGAGKQLWLVEAQTRKQVAKRSRRECDERGCELGEERVCILECALVEVPGPAHLVERSIRRRG